MEGFVDLHNHVLAGVDDGAATPAAALAMAQGLRALGYTCLVATPHARPGLFDPEDASLQEPLRQLRCALGAGGPRILLAGEHYLDDVIWNRIAAGQARLYPNRRALLVEVPSVGPAPARLAEQLFRLRMAGVRPVMAHPERISAFQNDLDLVDELRRGGTLMALDLTSLVGHGGRHARKTADRLLERGAIDLACTDIHAPEELPEMEKSLKLLRKLGGDALLEQLLHTVPIRTALAGTEEETEAPPACN